MRTSTARPLIRLVTITRVPCGSGYFEANAPAVGHIPADVLEQRVDNRA